MSRTSWLIAVVGLALLILAICLAEIHYDRIMRQLGREVDR